MQLSARLVAVAVLGLEKSGSTGRWDAAFEEPGVTFFVEYKPGSAAEDVGSALR